MAQFPLDVNGHSRTIEADGEMPLLWALRDLLQLTGTKYGCGIGMCGACTVHLDGATVRSCQTTVADARGKKVTTIEGLGENGNPRGPEGMDRRTGPAMRLLPVRSNHGSECAAEQNRDAE